jgi:hypothetical protein
VQQRQKKERQEVWKTWLEMQQPRPVEASTMALVVMGVPWSQHTPLQVHNPIRQLGMGPTALLMVPPGKQEHQLQKSHMWTILQVMCIVYNHCQNLLGRE